MAYYNGKKIIAVNVGEPSSYTGSYSITENGTIACNGKKMIDDLVVNVTAPSPIMQEKTATSNGDVVADSGYDGLSKVVVNVPSPTFIANKQITSNGSYNAEQEGVDYYKQVNVNVPLPSNVTFGVSNEINIQQLTPSSPTTQTALSENASTTEIEGKVVVNDPMIKASVATIDNQTITTNGETTFTTAFPKKVTIAVPQPSSYTGSYSVNANGTIACSGKKMTSDVVVNVPQPSNYTGSYSITENATIPCNGKKMTSDLVVNVPSSGGNTNVLFTDILDNSSSIQVSSSAGSVIWTYQEVGVTGWLNNISEGFIASPVAFQIQGSCETLGISSFTISANEFNQLGLVNIYFRINGTLYHGTATLGRITVFKMEGDIITYIFDNFQYAGTGPNIPTTGSFISANAVSMLVY